MWRMKAMVNVVCRKCRNVLLLEDFTFDAKTKEKKMVQVLPVKVTLGLPLIFVYYF